MRKLSRRLSRLLCLQVLGAAAAAPAHAAQHTALGDSLTQGYNADPGTGQSAKHPHGFAPTLRRLLELNSRAPYTFDNRGVYGATSASVRSGQLASLSPAPDLVTITVGANDATGAAANFAVTEAAYRGTGAGTFYDNLNAILSALRTGAPSRRIVLANVPDLKRLPAVAAQGALAQGRVDLFVRATNDIIAERAAAYGATVVDLYNDANATAPANISSPPEVGGDGFHPNRRGHDLLAARFVAGVNLGTVIDFQSLEHNDGSTTGAPNPYTEDGFEVAAPQAVSFGTQDARYPGSTALFSDMPNGLISLRKSNNTVFDLASIDLAEINGPGAVTVTFTGTRADNSTVTQSFTTDGAFTTNNRTNNDAQTFTFPATFTNLVKVEWRQVFPFHQFDNIVTRDTVAAPFAPAEADLSVAASAPATARAGTTLSYTVAVTNGGAATEQGASLEFPLPAGTTFASITAPAGWAPSTPAVGASGTVRAASSAFAPGTATFTIVVNVPASASLGSTLSATATVDGLTPDPDYTDRSRAASTQVLEAPSLVVTTLSDTSTDTDGETSLREAIAFANSDRSTADTIFFANGLRGAIDLTRIGDDTSGNSAFALQGPVTIQGPGADVLTVRRSSGGDYRVFFVGVGVTASISGLTISNGNGNGGAGLYSFGDLTLTACTVSDNVSSGLGGGIRNFGTRLAVRGCTISGNVSNFASSGGGIDSSAALELSNSTISGNSAPVGDGNAGGVRASATTTITGCTITGNRAAGASSASGLFVNAAVALSSTILAGNQNNGSQPDVAGFTGAASSNGYNLIGNPGATAFNGAGDQKGTPAAPLDPQVLALALNAPGTTATHALRPGSPAVDAGNPATAAGTDQRGLPRVRRGRADIGAFEVQNERPSNAPIAKGTDEDTALDFTLADFTGAFSDPDAGDTLSRIRITSLPSTGTLKLGAANVTLNQEVAASSLGTLSYVPEADASGVVSFGYLAADAYGFAASGSTVTITIAAVNDAPVLAGIEGSALRYTEGAAATPLTGTLTVSDADTDLASATVSITGGFVSGEDFLVFGDQNGITGSYVPATGVLTLSGAATPAQYEAALRTVKYLNASGDNPTASDRTVSFRANDGTASSNALTRTLTVVAVNDGPRNFVPGAQSTGEDTALAFSGTGSSPNGLLVTDSDTVALTVTLSVSHGTLTLSRTTRLAFTMGDGTADATMTFSGPQRDINAALEGLAYTPTPNFNGGDVLTLTTSDGSAPAVTDTVAITVSAVNDGPGAQPDSAATNEDTPLDVQVLANDTDAEGDALTVARVAVTSATHGTVAIAADKKSVRFVPEANYNGPATFTYTITDGALESTATVTVTVRPVNDAPVAQDQSLAATAAPLAITLGATDIDSPQASLTFTLLTQPQNGTLSGSGASLRYAARRGFSGTDSFTFRASDGSLNSNVATITLRVSDSNRAPLAQADAISTPFNTAASIQVLANDTDADGDTLSVSAVDTAGTRGTVSLASDRKSVLFTPESGFSGSTSFGYTISDGVASSSARVSVQVLASTTVPNRAPVAVADSYSTRGRLQVLAADGVLRNDSDADGQALTAILQSTPGHGELSFNRDGSFTYTPSVVYAGLDSFTYLAFDGSAASAVVTVTLTVQTPRDVTPPQVALAGEAVQSARRLLPARGSAVDVYAVRGQGVVYSSGLRSIVLQLQRGDGQYFNGRTYQRAPFGLRTRLVNRSFFALADTLPASSPDGRYRWTAIATDNAGLVGRAQQSVLVDSRTPALVIETPAADAQGVARVQSLTQVAGRVSEASKIEVALRNASGAYFNGRAFASAPAFLAATSAGSAWTLRLPASLSLPPGRYSLTVRATDTAGNVGTAPRVVEVASAPAR